MPQTESDNYEELLRQARIGYQKNNMLPCTGKWFSPGNPDIDWPAYGCLAMATAAGRMNIPVPPLEEFPTEVKVKCQFVDREFSSYGDAWLDGVVDGWEGHPNYAEVPGGVDWIVRQDACDATECYKVGYTFGKMGREQILIPYERGEKPF